MGIDRWVGSLEVGKDADFLFERSSADTQTLCDETWIEGKQYYDAPSPTLVSDAMAEERAALLSKIQKMKPNENAGLTAWLPFRRTGKVHTLNNCYECRKAKP